MMLLAYSSALSNSSMQVVQLIKLISTNLYYLLLFIKFELMNQEQPPFTDLINFTLIDHYLKINKTNRDIYCKIFQIKQKLIGVLTANQPIQGAKNYKAFLLKKSKTTQNQFVKKTIDKDILKIKSQSEDDMMTWFQQCIEQTGSVYEVQEKIYNAYKKLLENKQSQQSSQQQSKQQVTLKSQQSKPIQKDQQQKPIQNKEIEIEIKKPIENKQNQPTHQIKKPIILTKINKTTNNSIIQIKPIPQKLQQKPPEKTQFDVKQLINFKSFDSYLDIFQNNQKLCSEIFQKKKKLMEQVQNKKMTGIKYKNLLQNALKTVKYQKTKQLIQLQLQQLNDSYEGNIDQWLKQTAQMSQFSMEQQIQKLQRKKRKQISQQKAPKKKNSVKIPSDQKYMSFRVLDNLIEQNRLDPKQFCLLYQKKIYMIEHIKQQKLTGEIYQGFLQSQMIAQIEEDTQFIIENELEEIELLFDGDQNQWFEGIVNESGQKYQEQTLLYQKYTNKKESNKEPKKSTKRQSNQRVSRHCQKAEVIQQSFRILSYYESLFLYFQQNDITQQKNRFGINYYIPAKKYLLAKIQELKDKEQITLQELISDKIEDINSDIFYGMNAQQLVERVQDLKKKLLSSIKSYKQYISKIRKQSNKKNINEVTKCIQRINSDIAYLDSIVKNKKTLIALPNIEQIKVQKYNTDFNSLKPNEIQVVINWVQGLKDEYEIRIYIIDMSHQRYKCKIKNGQQNISVKIQVSKQKIEEIIKGTDTKYLKFQIYSKGWFSKSLEGQQLHQFSFIRSSTVKQKSQFGHGIAIQFTSMIQKPKRYERIQINDCQLKKYPQYIHTQQVQKQFIKKNQKYIK